MTTEPNWLTADFDGAAIPPPIFSMSTDVTFFMFFYCSMKEIGIGYYKG